MSEEITNTQTVNTNPVDNNVNVDPQPAPVQVEENTNPVSATQNTTENGMVDNPVDNPVVEQQPTDTTNLQNFEGFRRDMMQRFVQQSPTMAMEMYNEARPNLEQQ